MSASWYLRTFTGFILLTLVLTKPASAQFSADVHIWFHAFIANDHAITPGTIIRTAAGTHVIKAPDMGPIYYSLRGTCFSTDDRGFDPSPTASARTTVEFVLRIRGRNLTVEKPPGREMARTGLTKNVDCSSGRELQPAKRASAGGIEVGEVRKQEFARVLFVKAAASDPFYKYVPAPDVDFSFVVTYDLTTKRLLLKGTTDAFPSFEGYYSLNGRPAQPIIQFRPAENATAFDLFDFGTGVNTRNFEAEIDLR